MPGLLDPEFARELEVLRRKLAVKARSGQAGERLGTQRGSSLEFLEHRAYAPPDDLHRIDWAAYARSGEPVLKLFRSDEDVVVRVVCDTSQSMSMGDPTKLERAQRIAAALGYLTLARGERAQLLLVGDRLNSAAQPLRGRGAVGAWLRSLEGLAASGRTDLSRGIEEALARAKRSGLLVVLSDFFDPGAVLRALGRAAGSGHDVALVQVLCDEDLNPSLDGDVELLDVETDERVELTIDGEALAAYGARLSALCGELRTFARRQRGSYVLARGEEPLSQVVRRIVLREID